MIADPETLAAAVSVYRRPWWTVAAAVARTGWDVTVMDPDADEPETYVVDGDPVNRGTIQVVPCVALCWTVLVQECEPDEDEDEDEDG